MRYEVLPTTSSHSSAVARESRARQLLIASNRLPVTLIEEGEAVRVVQSGGGLATGLSHVQRQWNAKWIGWTGLSETPPPSVRPDVDARLRLGDMTPVHLTRDDVGRSYHRFCNGVLWPILHEVDAAAYDAYDWHTYARVNAQFADVIVRELEVGDLVWVHDYHLMLVPRLVRARCPWARIGFFLHTPFPEPESFARLPHAEALLDGLLGSDTIGFHTDDYVERFIAAVDSTRRYRARHRVIQDHRRPVVVFASPMSIDAAEFSTIAGQPDVEAVALRERARGPLFVGIDRLDYTKGLVERLCAFERLLEGDADLVGRARLVQIAVPSREVVRAYRRVRGDVEETVRRINRRWATATWLPIDYRYTSLDRAAIVALYRAADVMLVTPIRDGLNLVAKEFVASRIDNDGVLVLSDRAGAAAELRTALLVDPTDERALTDAYVAALNMLPAERRVRMRHMRVRVAAHDVYRWADSAIAMLGVDSPSAGRLGGA